MLIYLILIMVSFFISSIQSNSHEDTIKNSYINIILLTFFLVIFFVLPSSFSSDQYEYYEIIESDIFSNLPFKTLFIGIVSYLPINWYGFEINDVRFLFFIISSTFIYFIGKKITGSSIAPLLFFLLPSVAIHSGLFLREPLIYGFLFIYMYYIYKDKIILSSISWVLIFFLRPDSAILVFPMFLTFFKNINLRIFFAIFGLIFTYFLLEFYEPLNFVFNSYRNMYDIDHNMLSSLGGIFNSFSNFFIGSRSLSIATILLLVETFILLYILYKLDNKIIALTLILMGIIIIGSISDNSGFILRLRSSIVIIFMIMYLKDRKDA